MQQSAFVLPIVPEQVEPCREFWNELNTTKSAELSDHLSKVGVHRLVASIQTSPIGPVLVQYLESDEKVKRALVLDENSKSDFQQWIMTKLREFSGIDYQDEATYPDEIIDDCIEHTEVTGPVQTLLFALPILPGKMDEYLAFAGDATGAKATEVKQYQLSLGTSKFLMVHQSLDGKDYLIQYWQTSEDPKTAVADIPELDTPTEKWVVDSFKSFTGEDTTANPPKFEIVFDKKS